MEYRSVESAQNIKRAWDCYRAVERGWQSDLFERICFTVIEVPSEDLAFTFFDTQNNRGVPLHATDLLKAFHLRAIAEPKREMLQTNCAKRWEQLQRTQPILGLAGDFAPALFNTFLWRARRWTGKNVDFESHEALLREFQDRTRTPDQSSATIPLFRSHHNRLGTSLTLHEAGDYELATNPIRHSDRPAELPIAIRQPINRGIGFFLFADKYAALTHELLNEKHAHPEVRAFFDIREEVNRFLHDRFNRLAENAADSGSGGEGTDAIQNALALIRSFLDDRKRVIDPAGFTAFVRNQVKLVLTRVPAQTDLNKLFEVINNRGAQLQHNEILKAWMLNALDPDDRSRYACLWDARAGMEDYVERNLRELTGIRVAELFTGDASATDSEPLAKAAKILEVLARRNEQPEDTTPLSLQAILAAAGSFEPSAGYTDGVTERESDKVRSICGFPMFLQHVLRIWLHRNHRRDIPRILDKELRRLFTDHFFAETAPPELAANVRSFIELLWDLRYLFDKHIIKWINRGEEEQHLILKPRLNISGNAFILSRETEEPEMIREFSMLQSMLCHSQQITTQYWMTPLLAYMHKGSGSVADEIADRFSKGKAHYKLARCNPVIRSKCRRLFVRRVRWCRRALAPMRRSKSPTSAPAARSRPRSRPKISQVSSSMPTT
jgi:hypothetical protein